jgi:hypothetical protein
MAAMWTFSLSFGLKGNANEPLEVGMWNLEVLETERWLPCLHVGCYAQSFQRTTSTKQIYVLWVKEEHDSSTWAYALTVPVRVHKHQPSRHDDLHTLHYRVWLLVLLVQPAHDEWLVVPGRPTTLTATWQLKHHDQNVHCAPQTGLNTASIISIAFIITHRRYNTRCA